MNLLRKPSVEEPLAKLERLRREQRRALSELDAVTEHLESLGRREAELAEADVAAYVGDCDEAEHDRQRRQLEVDKVAAATERDRLDRVVDGLQRRCCDQIRLIEQQQREQVLARRRSIETRAEELQVQLAALDHGYAAGESQLHEITAWRERQLRDGGLGREDDPPVRFPPEEQAFIASAPDFADVVTLPNGNLAYGRLPGEARVVNPHGAR
jgi:hypothetical protein